MKTKIPREFFWLFWDTDAQKLDPQKYPKYVIEKVLEFGDEKAVRWVFSLFEKREIKKVAKISRQLSPKARNFWFKFLQTR